MNKERVFIPHPEIHEIIAYETYKDASRAFAAILISEVKANPRLSITFATGNTQIPMLQELEKAVSAGRADFSQVTASHLDEYLQSREFAEYLRIRAFDPLRIKPENRHIINGMATSPDTEANRYESLLNLIKPEVIILGIGPRSHVGFNKVGTPFTAGVHVTDLDAETIARDKARGEYVSDYAITQGPSNIAKARSRILMAAYGKEKGDYVFETLYEPVSPMRQASVLRLPGVGSKVTIIIDKEAYDQIELRKRLSDRKKNDLLTEGISQV